MTTVSKYYAQQNTRFIFNQKNQRCALLSLLNFFWGIMQCTLTELKRVPNSYENQAVPCIVYSIAFIAFCATGLGTNSTRPNMNTLLKEEAQLEKEKNFTPCFTDGEDRSEIFTCWIWTMTLSSSYAFFFIWPRAKTKQERNPALLRIDHLDT